MVNLEEFRSFPRRYGALVLPEWLQDIPQAWLIVPLTVADDMIGFVVLALCGECDPGDEGERFGEVGEREGSTQPLRRLIPGWIGHAAKSGRYLT